MPIASPPPPSSVDRLGFRFVWPVKVATRQLSPNETIILQISPKFATVHDHVSFQWSLKMHGTANLESEDEEENDSQNNKLVLDEDGEVYRTIIGDYVAISLYYVDGPVSTVQLKANVRVVGEKEHVVDERKTVVSVSRGRECELAYTDHREHLSKYIKDRVGQVIRLSLHLEMDSSLFRTDTYLNAVSPTPIHSFLTANYRARASSKVWRKRSKHNGKRPRSASDGQPNSNKKLDLERTFNCVMERERSRRRLCEELSLDNNGHVTPPIVSAGVAQLRRNSSTTALVTGSCTSDAQSTASSNAQPLVPLLRIEGVDFSGACGDIVPASPAPTTPTRTTFFVPPDHRHLFKQLLVACCDSCERRASIIPTAPDDEDDEPEEEDDDADAEDGEDTEEEDDDNDDDDSEDEKADERIEATSAETGEQQAGDASKEITTFECLEENKTEMHDTLANMYFNKIALPEMEYVEDFADFLIDAELNDLPVLKRACERYLCGELNTKKDLMTSLLLDLLFLSMVFHLPVMKSMTLTELCDRYTELEDVNKLLQQEEYRNLDTRIRQICDRNLSDLIDECKRFREQRLRVHPVSVSSTPAITPI